MTHDNYDTLQHIKLEVCRFLNNDLLWPLKLEVHRSINVKRPLRNQDGEPHTLTMPLKRNMTNISADFINDTFMASSYSLND